jgi:transposase
MRGLLLDRGIAIGAAATRSCRLIPKIVCEPNEVLTELIREITGSLYAFMLQIDQPIRAFDEQIDAIFKGSEACQRIAKISGVGPKTATAMIAAIGNGSGLKMAATWPHG